MSGRDASAVLTASGFTNDLASSHILEIGIDEIPFVRTFYWRSYDSIGRIVVDVLLPVEDHSYRPEDMRLMELWNAAQVKRAEEETKTFEDVQSVLNICS